MSGKLDLLIGPMYATKSVTLMNRLIIASELGLKVLYINHAFDVRSSHVFSTHHPFMTLKAQDNIEFVSLSSLRGTRREEFDVIGIDEAQFFDKSLIDFVKVHVEVYRRHVIVAGLDGDSKREKFGYILDLIPLCDTVTKLRPYCQECGPKKTKALFSHKYHSSEGTESTAVDVGGKEKYKPLCRECYLKFT